VKAVVVREFGAPDVLRFEDLPIPSPAPDEVVVRVHAAGVGPWDALVRSGKSGLPQPLPLIPGSDLSGTVFSAGENAASAFQRGMPVYGDTNPRFTGAYAEFAECLSAMLAPKPATLDFIEAASVPVVAVTAWQMLFEHARVQPGQSVLIHGAAGNVGAYAVQLAKHAGAFVIASATAGDREYVTSLGADRFIDWRAQRFDDAVQNVDVVLDTVGGDTLQRSFRVVRRGGIVVSSVSQPPQEDAERAGARAVFFFAAVTTHRLDKISALIDAGVLKTHVGEVLRLDQARTAHEMLAGAPHRPGKIVLRLSDEGEGP
jgi:NADPH:quinone reductase-like Zn-dependent oxidoreductase